MKKEEVFNQGVLSNLSNLSDSQNASQSADNQQEVMNADGAIGVSQGHYKKGA